MAEDDSIIPVPRNSANYIFSFNGKDFRAVTNNRIEWFVADDICSVLSINNTSQAVGRLDDDEYSIQNVLDGMGRLQPTLCVSESGLYSLILTSRKKEAKEFKRWVTHEVLPEIRRSGGYIAPSLTSAQIARLRAKLSFRDMTNAIQDAYHQPIVPHFVYSTLADTENKAVLGFTKRTVQEKMNISEEQAEHFRDFIGECALLALEAVETLSAARIRTTDPKTQHVKDLQAIIREVADILTPAFRAVAEGMSVDFVTGQKLITGGQ